MSVKTQGTELFFIDPVSDALVQMTCPTGITGLGGAADQIDTTCLNATSRTYEKGLNNPAQITVPFNLDPTAVSHQSLFDWQESGVDLKFCICLSDGTADPTVVAGEFVAPASRTSFIFGGYIADVNLDIATNEIVRGTLVIQRSGAVTATWND